MPTRSKFANLYLYNDTTDKAEKFIQFRSLVCGTGYDSNMNIIDEYLSTHNTNITNINTKIDEIFIQHGGETLINATTLSLKPKSYYENVANTYNATCGYSDNLYSLVLSNTEISIPDNIFTLRFPAPNNFVKGSTFYFSGTEYTPLDPAFDEGQVVLLNFDKTTAKCYFSSGSGKGVATDITINPIEGLESTNVQGAFVELLAKITTNTTNIATNTLNISKIVDGTTKVAKAAQADNATNATTAVNSTQLGGKDLSYVLNYNNLTNKPIGGGIQVSSVAPSVALTTLLWIDLGNNAMAKYSNGSAWIPVGTVWK